MDKTAVGRLRSKNLFPLCVKASIAKCFEFNVHCRCDPDPKDAFFVVPSLRSICEDLIILGFIKKIPRIDREALIQLLMSHDVHSRIKAQDAFFRTVRPQQPVLRVKDVDAQISLLESKAQAIWNRHGWPNLRHGAMPQIRQVAEKLGLPALTSLYDYLYRLTSSGVHFSVQTLLRSGWGSTKDRCTFSTRNFDRYFATYCRVYGAFLFCVYFEFFGRFLRPPVKVTETIEEIRRSVFLESRWPEMITFEEMNLEVPQQGDFARITASWIQSQTKRKFIE